MQAQHESTEFQRRFGRMELSKKANATLGSSAIAQQIAEFESRGGKINLIPTGVSALYTGAVVVSEEPHSMAVPRNAKSNVKTTTDPGNPDMTVAEAAAFLGKSSGYITKRIATGKLTSKKVAGCRAHFVKRDEVQRLKDNLNQGQK